MPIPDDSVVGDGAVRVDIVGDQSVGQSGRVRPSYVCLVPTGTGQRSRSEASSAPSTSVSCFFQTSDG